MDVGIRIDQLRKVFTSPPPVAAMARGGPMGGQRLFSRPAKKKADQVVALDGISLEVTPGESAAIVPAQRPGGLPHERRAAAGSPRPSGPPGALR